jgi:hypothetical protein
MNTYARRVVKEAISKLMSETGLNAKEAAKAVLSVPELRRGLSLLEV